MSRNPALDHPAVLATVIRVLRSELGFDAHPVEPGDRLDLLPEADSVRLMRAVSTLERLYGTELDDNDVHAAETVADLVALLQEHATTGPEIGRAHV